MARNSKFVADDKRKINVEPLPRRGLPVGGWYAVADEPGARLATVFSTKVEAVAHARLVSIRPFVSVFHEHPLRSVFVGWLPEGRRPLRAMIGSLCKIVDKRRN